MHQLQIEFPGQEKYWTDNNFVRSEERSKRFIVGKMKRWTSSQACKDFEAKLSRKYASSLPELDPNDENFTNNSGRCERLSGRSFLFRWDTF